MAGIKGMKRKSNTTPGHSGLNKVHHMIRYNAKIRNLYFNLTHDELKKITSQNCFYCNSIPKQVAVPRSNSATESWMKHGTYVYNGLDRINSDEGYTIDNVVPCCLKCNKAKSNLTTLEFKDLITSIYTHFIKDI